MKIILLALRSMMRFRAFSIINIIGLALSLMCMVIISRYVYRELTMDQFHRKKDRIHLVTQERDHAPGQIVLGAIPHEDIRLLEDASVERKTLVNKRPNGKITVDQSSFVANIIAVDTNFLYIFDFPVVSGAFDAARRDQALISTELARKIWGEDVPIGKTFQLPDGGVLTVTGLVDMKHVNSSFTFDVIVSQEQGRFHANEDSYQLFLLLYPNSNYKEINNKYDVYIESGHAKFKYQIVPFKGLYLNNHYGGFSYFHNIFEAGNTSVIYILILIGILILTIGIVSYMNINTVVVLRRGKEFGVKKVFGARGRSIFFQLLSENLVLISLSLILAFSLIELTSPLLDVFLGFPTVSFRFFDLIVGVFLFVGLPFLTTITPYLNFTYSSPVRSLKKVKIQGVSFQGQVFLGLQYVVTMVMLILAFHITKHFYLMLKSDPGYTIENVVEIDFGRRFYGEIDENPQVIWRRMQTFKDLVAKNPYLEGWTHGENPTKPYFKVDHPFETNTGTKKIASFILVNPNWLEFFGLEIVQGRPWSKDPSLYEQTFYELLLTESTWNYYGFENLDEATLQANQVIVGSYDGSRPLYKVVGVVKDFTVGHIQENLSPLVLHFLPEESAMNLFVKIAPGRKQQGIHALAGIYQEAFGEEFRYSLLTDERNDIYRGDKRIAMIYSIFTVIALIVSVMGLFSMSLYDIQQRYKEIAIRKVNGAMTKDIIIMILKKYLKLLTVGFIIAIPLGCFALFRYQQEFVIKISLAVWIFIAIFLITALITILTLLQQTLKAAKTNPASIMRSE